MTQQTREYDIAMALGEKKPPPIDATAAQRRGERKKAERIKRALLQAEIDAVTVDPDVMARVRGALNGYNKGVWTTRNH